MVHGPEESPESLAFASEPLIGSLVNILSSCANSSADSYDGSGSNRHGSFDLGLDTSKNSLFQMLEVCCKLTTISLMSSTDLIPLIPLDLH